MPCPVCGMENGHKWGCVNYVGMHDGVDAMLSDEQLASIRKNIKERKLKLPQEVVDTRLEIDGFMTGAFFMCEVMQRMRIDITMGEKDLFQAAQEFYPPYDPLPEPTKANAAGNAPPLAIPRK